MLRRFEIYSLREDASPAAIDRLRGALRDSSRFIPEVLHSAVGTNLSDAPVHLIWEHAYESPEAYQRYMVHPFHACVLDRYLLRDSPERVVSDNDLGAGLIGYACERPEDRLRTGVRRIVLLRVADGAGEQDLATFAARARAARDEVSGMTVSVFAANTFANRWFDGVTPITAASRWTHLWEQSFASLDDVDRYLEGDSALARAERSGWSGWMEGIVRRAANVKYRIEPGYGFA